MRCMSYDRGDQMSQQPFHTHDDDDTVQTRLDRIHATPLPVDGTESKQIAELDQLAEIMIGRPSTNEAALKAAIQTEVLRRGPDRGITPDQD